MNGGNVCRPPLYLAPASHQETPGRSEVSSHPLAWPNFVIRHYKSQWNQQHRGYFWRVWHYIRVILHECDQPIRWSFDQAW